MFNPFALLAWVLGKVGLIALSNFFKKDVDNPVAEAAVNKYKLDEYEKKVEVFREDKKIDKDITDHPDDDSLLFNPRDR